MGSVDLLSCADQSLDAARSWVVTHELAIVASLAGRLAVTSEAPTPSRGERRVGAAISWELSGRHGITRAVLGLRAGSLPEVKLASAWPTRRRAASA